MKKPWGKLAPNFSNLVTSKSNSVSGKYGKSVASEKICSHWRPQQLQRRALYNHYHWLFPEVEPTAVHKDMLKNTGESHRTETQEW